MEKWLSLPLLGEPANVVGRSDDGEAPKKMNKACCKLCWEGSCALHSDPYPNSSKQQPGKFDGRPEMDAALVLDGCKSEAWRVF